MTQTGIILHIVVSLICFKAAKSESIFWRILGMGYLLARGSLLVLAGFVAENEPWSLGMGGFAFLLAIWAWFSHQW